MTERKPKIPKKITERYLYNSGLYYLQRFTASSEHFRFIMMRKINKSCKHHTEQDLEECKKHLDKVITDFIKLGHLNDDAYCTGMVTSMRRRGLSRKMISTKLQQKRLPSDLIEKTLNHIDEQNSDNENPDLRAAVLHAKKKRLGAFAHTDKKLNDEEQEKAKNRTLGSLARAGYSFGIAQRVLDMDMDEALEVINSDPW